MSSTYPSIAGLTRLGLTTYEAKAYLTLLGRDSFTAAQVARRGGLPRQRIYDVLPSLVEKGLASTRPGDVVKYTAVSPALALERLMAAHRRRLADLEESVSAMVEELEPAYRSGQEESDPLDFIEVLRDPGAINERFAELQASITREILVFTRPPFATPPQDNPDGLVVASTYETRSIYEWSVLEDPETAAGVRAFIEAGEEARFVEHLPLKLVVVDEAVAMFGMEDPVGTRRDLTMMVVEHPSLAWTLKLAFEALWSDALSLEETEARLTTTS